MFTSFPRISQPLKSGVNVAVVVGVVEPEVVADVVGVVVPVLVIVLDAVLVTVVVPDVVGVVGSQLSTLADAPTAAANSAIFWPQMVSAIGLTAEIPGTASASSVDPFGR